MSDYIQFFEGGGPLPKSGRAGYLELHQKTMRAIDELMRALGPGTIKRRKPSYTVPPIVSEHVEKLEGIEKPTRRQKRQLKALKDAIKDWHEYQVNHPKVPGRQKGPRIARRISPN